MVSSALAPTVCVLRGGADPKAYLTPISLAPPAMSESRGALNSGFRPSLGCYHVGVKEIVSFEKQRFSKSFSQSVCKTISEI